MWPSEGSSNHPGVSLAGLLVFYWLSFSVVDWTKSMGNGKYLNKKKKFSINPPSTITPQFCFQLLHFHCREKIFFSLLFSAEGESFFFLLFSGGFYFQRKPLDGIKTMCQMSSVPFPCGTTSTSEWYIHPVGGPVIHEATFQTAASSFK